MRTRMSCILRQLTYPKVFPLDHEHPEHLKQGHLSLSLTTVVRTGTDQGQWVERQTHHSSNSARIHSLYTIILCTIYLVIKPIWIYILSLTERNG